LTGRACAPTGRSSEAAGAAASLLSPDNCFPKTEHP